MGIGIVVEKAKGIMYVIEVPCKPSCVFDGVEEVEEVLLVCVVGVCC